MKMEGATLGAGAMSAVSGLLGGAAGIIASKRQLKAIRETNKLKYQMFKEQMDYQDRTWERQAEYDSAKAQRQRLEAAGLNPNIMMNGGNAGSASGMASPAIPDIQPAYQDPSVIQSAWKQIGDSGMPILQAMTSISEAQARIKSQELQQKLSDQQAKLNEMLNPIVVSLKRNELHESGMKLTEQALTNDKMRLEIDKLDNENKAFWTDKNAEWKKIAADVNARTTEYYLKMLELGYSDERIQKELKILDEQGRNEVKRGIQLDAQTRGINLNNRSLDIYLDGYGDTLSKGRESARISYEDSNRSHIAPNLTQREWYVMGGTNGYQKNMDMADSIYRQMSSESRRHKVDAGKLVERF